MKKILLLLLTAPTLALAASELTLSGIVAKLVGIINVTVPVLISLAIVLFFFHTGKGIFGNAQSGAEAKSQLKETLLWGVLIIFVMVSIWGILNIFGSELDLMKSSFTG